ncbi:MAG TPA: hypothetical protein VGV87_22445 [Blastocatellia bacterium]|nr:hypothetical protein [Blastocatellia bacterium]
MDLTLTPELEQIITIVARKINVILEGHVSARPHYPRASWLRSTSIGVKPADTATGGTTNYTNSTNQHESFVVIRGIRVIRGSVPFLTRTSQGSITPSTAL